MALIWRCDRCSKTSDMGSVEDDQPPEDWVRRSMPVRGSEGARSNSDALLCTECDDALYRWLHHHQGAEVGAVPEDAVFIWCPSCRAWAADAGIVLPRSR